MRGKIVPTFFMCKEEPAFVEKAVYHIFSTGTSVCLYLCVLILNYKAASLRVVNLGEDARQEYRTQPGSAASLERGFFSDLAKSIPYNGLVQLRFCRLSIDLPIEIYILP